MLRLASCKFTFGKYNNNFIFVHVIAEKESLYKPTKTVISYTILVTVMNDGHWNADGSWQDSGRFTCRYDVLVGLR